MSWVVPHDRPSRVTRQGARDGLRALFGAEGAGGMDEKMARLMRQLDQIPYERIAPGRGDS